MPRLTKKEKAKVELEFIEKSKEVDKFDYDIRLKVMIATYGGIFTLFIAGLNKNIFFLWLSASIALISFPLICALIMFYPITRDFKKKRKMERKRYEVLGIKPIELDSELKNTLLKK